MLALFWLVFELYILILLLYSAYIIRFKMNASRDHILGSFFKLLPFLSFGKCRQFLLNVFIEFYNFIVFRLLLSFHFCFPLPIFCGYFGVYLCIVIQVVGIKITICLCSLLEFANANIFHFKWNLHKLQTLKALYSPSSYDYLKCCLCIHKEQH